MLWQALSDMRFCKLSLVVALKSGWCTSIKRFIVSETFTKCRSWEDQLITMDQDWRHHDLRLAQRTARVNHSQIAPKLQHAATRSTASPKVSYCRQEEFKPVLPQNRTACSIQVKMPISSIACYYYHRSTIILYPPYLPYYTIPEILPCLRQSIIAASSLAARYCASLAAYVSSIAYTRDSFSEW